LYPKSTLGTWLRRVPRAFLERRYIVHILAVDVGTGTQDILLYDTTREPENALKMIMPAPTLLVAQAIRRATAAGDDVLLTGYNMGGGPNAWAARDHVRAGRRVFATPSAACTLDDDLQAVAEMGVQVISEEEAQGMSGVRRMELRDVDLGAIRSAFGAFSVPLEADAVCIAVFDHGAAPPGYSDRRFRFEYLKRRLSAEPHVSALAFMRNEIPARMTRMQAAADQVGLNCPTLVMDTPAAAILGAREDPVVQAAGDAILVNVGNSHTLAFRLQGDRVTGLFEHHTGKLTTERLDGWIDALASGTIRNDDVYADSGHGAVIMDTRPMPSRFLSATGPRRGMLRGSRHRPYFAVPYGDMMVAGCWGLIRALAIKAPGLAGEIQPCLL
jgi:uncharacterized protein (DUF1786 family)